MKREKKARQYLIDLQRWRSAAAFIACGITLFFSVTSIVDALIYYSQRGWLIRDYFRYFTTLSRHWRQALFSPLQQTASGKSGLSIRNGSF